MEGSRLNIPDLSLTIETSLLLCASTNAFDTQDMSSNYNALQAKYEHRFSHGFNLLGSCSWSKWLQFNQVPALGGNTGYEFTRAALDIPHNLAVNGIYLLPFGRGRHFLTNGQAAIRREYRQPDHFSLPRESTLSLRAEFFNVSNTTSLNSTNAMVDVAAGGRVTATSNAPREIQLALKYSFQHCG